IPGGGKVWAGIKGGYEVTVGGLRGFCPFSQMDLRRVDATEEYVGRVLEFRVTTFSDNGRNLVLSRRRLLEERAAEAAEETRKKIAPGVVLAGTVASLADFGAFIDLGGVQGLVPLSELSYSRASRPADLLRVGDAGGRRRERRDGRADRQHRHREAPRRARPGAGRLGPRTAHAVERRGRSGAHRYRGAARALRRLRSPRSRADRARAHRRAVHEP